MAQPYPPAQIPTDGRITSLTALPGNTLTGSEAMEIVAPGTAAAGYSYQVLLNQLAQYFTANPAAAVYTVATLPAGTQGGFAAVSDGDSGLAWGATVINSGSGATPYAVWYNGSHWTVMGK